jgi:murein DD-endopeptidase MepM/ murein hydrolase activator NlpD
VEAPKPVEAPEVEPQPTPAPSPVPEPAPSRSPAASESSSNAPAETAKTQRQQEVEQALIQLTNQTRARQKEQQQQQAATEAAKYLEAGDINQAQLATQFITLPADVRAKLLQRIAEAQARKGKPTVAKGAKPGVPPAGVSAGAEGQGLATGYAAPPGGYSTQAILPSMPIGLSFPFGKLMGKGNFKLSFPLGVIAPITSVFGWRIHPIDGSPRFHRGTDFGAPYGSPVVAAMAGVVEAAGYMDGYGLTVILRHNHQQTLYAHMSQVFVQPGETLQQGQLLGQVGSTGNSTGPHLHFEVHQLTDQGWQALDPAAVLNQALAIAQQLPSKPLAFNGQLVNLSVSGLLDVNAPSPNFSAFNGSAFDGGDLLLSSLLAPFSQQQAPVRVPVTLLPPAIPELGWLISPFVNNLLAGQAAFLSLPSLPETPQTISFQSIPSLPTKVAEPVAANPWVTTPSNPPQLRVATSQPLAHLTIAESLPGVVNVASLRQPSPRQPRTALNRADTQVTQSFQPIQVTEQGLQSLKLADNRNRK